MRPESSETPAEIFTMLGELNGLPSKNGEKSVGQFVENAMQQASVEHSVSIFEKLKIIEFSVLSIATVAPILYCLLLYTNLVVCTMSAFSKVRGYRQNSLPPQYEVAEIEMPDLPPNRPSRP